MQWLEQGGALYVWDPQSLPKFAPSMFNLEAPDLAAKRVSEGGRNAAWFINLAGQNAVLKYYQRGGVMAHFNQSYYFWAGRAQVRSLAEFALLQNLYQLGLPVPRVLAAACWRKGVLFYRAAIMTQRIEGATPLAKSAHPKNWFDAGQMVLKMHQHGVWHADLNAFNILLDPQQKVWLIDFDRAQQGVTDSNRLSGNIDRLARSVRKVASAQFNLIWPAFLAGYQGQVSLN